VNFTDRLLDWLEEETLAGRLTAEQLARLRLFFSRTDLPCEATTIEARQLATTVKVPVYDSSK
jgi:hypothetical protein